jgi:hypothetical protein
MTQATGPLPAMGLVAVAVPSPGVGPGRRAMIRRQEGR